MAHKPPHHPTPLSPLPYGRERASDVLKELILLVEEGGMVVRTLWWPLLGPLAFDPNSQDPRVKQNINAKWARDDC